MTTFIAIGDPHFQVKNIIDVEKFIIKITDIATEKQPSFIVILGDVLHTHETLHTTPLNKAYEFIDAMRNIAPTFVLVGNHDMLCNSNFLNNNHWMNSMKEWDGVTIVDKVVHRNIGGLNLVFCPYVPPGRFEEALSTVNSDEVSTPEGEWKDADIIFAHQEFYGCKMGAFDSVDGDRWSLDSPSVISGHIHDRQTPQENIYYVGSSMQHAFGESANKTILYQENGDDGDVLREEIKLGLPKKKIVYKSVEDFDDYIFKETTDQIKLTLSGSAEKFKLIRKTKKYKEAIEKGVKIAFKPEKKINKTEETITNTTDFDVILKDIVLNSKDPYLVQVYEQVVNGKDSKVEDVFFL